MGVGSGSSALVIADVAVTKLGVAGMLSVPQASCH